MAWVPVVVAGLCAFCATIHIESRKHGITVGMNNIVHHRSGSFVQNPATTSHKGSISGVMQPEEMLKTYRFSPQWQYIASQGNRKPGTHRPHYSADYRRGIVPSQPFLSGNPTPNFLATPANPNKIGHGNSVSSQCDLWSPSNSYSRSIPTPATNSGSWETSNKVPG